MDDVAADCALMMSETILELVGPCLFAEEREEAIEQLAAVCKAGVEAYQMHCNRLRVRLGSHDHN